MAGAQSGSGGGGDGGRGASSRYRRIIDPKPLVFSSSSSETYAPQLANCTLIGSVTACQGNKCGAGRMEGTLVSRCLRTPASAYASFRTPWTDPYPQIPMDIEPCPRVLTALRGKYAAQCCTSSGQPAAFSNIELPMHACRANH